MIILIISLKEERRVWLEFHKKKWKFQVEERRERKRRRIDFGDTSSFAPVTSSHRGIGGFLRRTARSVMDMPWQIVQVE
jgi:DNA polymerase epsilon subunit 1